jgi:hypothetical protein
VIGDECQLEAWGGCIDQPDQGLYYRFLVATDDAEGQTI